MFTHFFQKMIISAPTIPDAIPSRPIKLGYLPPIKVSRVSCQGAYSYIKA